MLEEGAKIQETYIIKKELDSGGGGIVYLAYHKRLEKDVVIKQIRAESMDYLDKRAEVDVLKKLRHSCLPQVYDFLEIGNSIYTVMEFIPGENLQKAVKSHGPYGQREILKWAIQLAETLVYIHGQKPRILHGDIKPANIMLTPDGNVCLIDFNISLMLQEEQKGQMNWATPFFAPPEQYNSLRKYMADMGFQNLLNNKQDLDPEATVNLEERGKEGGPSPNVRRDSGAEFDFESLRELVGSGIDERSDIYSLGAALYILATGKRADIFDVLSCPANKRNPGISEGLGAIINICLSPFPEKRFQTASDLLYALRHTEIYDSGYRAERRKRFAMLFGFATVLFVVLLLGIFFFNRYRTERHREYLGQVEEALSSGSMDYEQAVRLLREASGMEPKSEEAYLAMMLLLNRHYEYEECLSYASDTILPHIPGAAENGRFCYLLAEAYDGIGEKKEACRYYGMAAERTGNDPGFLLDYIVSLIENGDVEEAGRNLEVWNEKGRMETEKQPDDGNRMLGVNEKSGNEKALASFLSARIYFEEERIQDAEKEALEALGSASEDRLKKNIILFLSDLYGHERLDGNVAEAYEKEISVLQRGGNMFESGYDIEVLERLGKAEYEYASLSGEAGLFEKAADDFEKLIAVGYDRPYIYRNIAVICQLTGDLARAEETLSEMRERYPNDYMTWYQCAMLELDREAVKPFEERDYGKASEYYERMLALVKGREEEQEIEPLKRRMQDILANTHR